MKRFILIFVFIFVLISYNEIKDFNNSMESIKAINEVSQACHVDMQKDKGLICD